jgi:hypothetical protein
MLYLYGMNTNRILRSTSSRSWDVLNNGFCQAKIIQVPGISVFIAFSDADNEDGELRTVGTGSDLVTLARSLVCPECDQIPVGLGCYHLCSHSAHYYSPEQERRDDVTYGDSDRWEGYDDPDLTLEGW